MKTKFLTWTTTLNKGFAVMAAVMMFVADGAARAQEGSNASDSGDGARSQGDEESHGGKPMTWKARHSKEKKSFVDPATPKNTQPAGPKGNWVLTFSDEFNSGTLDSEKWGNRTVQRQGGNHGVDWGWDAANVSLEKHAGRLAIETRKVGGNKFSSGCIATRGLFSQRYGFFEARLKAPPKNNGHQAAFWLMPAGGQMGVGKPGAEIDVVETHLAADKGSSTLHWNGYQKEGRHSAGKTWNAPELHEGFHTYGVEWTPQMVRVYYDGQAVWTHEGKGVPSVEEYIICSVGILNWCDGDIHKADLPQRTLFDWVRVYERGK